MKPRKKPSSTRTRPTASGSRLRSDKEMGFVSYINLAEDEPAAAQCENRAVNATNAAAGIACEENSLLKDYVTEKGLIPHPHLPPQLLLSKFRLSDSKMFSPLKDDRYAGCRRTEEGFIK
ncbi:cysteine/Histidine-rich C1 domain family protein [Striga asiatica]|uniref:Cysteine/Histidine-rich C1 domain family protein n=1 Tax=Striga asiatica TaxID=4170 RepID=A0A5A7PY51_STRAF|nr:cysteine/Histidine-rich C1 domain family protein [Striga asiatica]